MKLLIAFNPIGLIVLDTETKEIEETYKYYKEPHRLYGVEQIGEYIYIGYTHEVVKLNWITKEVEWIFTDPKFHHVHSVTKSWDNNIWATSALNDRAFKLDQDGNVIDMFYVKDYFPLPSWYIEHDDWRKTNIATIDQWSHMNYFSNPKEGVFYFSLFHLLDNDKLYESTGLVGRIKNKEMWLTDIGGQLRSPHCIIENDGALYIANSGREKIYEIRYPAQGIIMENLRCHHIEPIDNNRLLITDCSRIEPRLLIYDISKETVTWIWWVPREYLVQARKVENYIQPYVAKVLKS